MTILSARALSLMVRRERCMVVAWSVLIFRPAAFSMSINWVGVGRVTSAISPATFSFSWSIIRFTCRSFGDLGKTVLGGVAVDGGTSCSAAGVTSTDVVATARGTLWATAASTVTDTPLPLPSTP
ncbi:hypothetical protein DPMN_005208 [Dreissena polymorpha]|uniref:Uncharacterized protein n=1 Tax=Dreissena polymorpha TaxID=45954 RepID=A0A9D4MPU7_DREPO|nr:hypothetical protein DPMN_005208 [Dreissena polymorpha]